MYKRIIALTFAIFLLCSTQGQASHTYNTRIIEKIMPAVVEVLSERFDSHLNKPVELNKKGFKFRKKNPASRDRDKEPTRSGSGFLISPKGYVITNAHVITNIANKQGVAHLTFKNGEIYDAVVVNHDVDSDIALLKIKDAENIEFPFVVWGVTPEIGDKAIAIGSPMNLSFTATFGHISALDRPVPNVPSYVPFIQTDASVNPGNSGGPLFNEHGKVIGINTMVMTDKGSKGSIGLGFAIDGDYAQDIIWRLKKGEEIERPFVGILYRALTKKDMDLLKMSFREYLIGHGAYIEDIVPTGPANNILRAGDIILKVDGKEIFAKSLSAVIVKRKINADVIFTILRDGQLLDLTVKLGNRKHDK